LPGCRGIGLKTSIIITTANEPKLAEDCMINLINQIASPDISLLVVAPDKETEDICKKWGIAYLKDEGKGKIAAMNAAFNQVDSDIIIWTDGDCIVENVHPLIESLENPETGAAGGRVVPLESRGAKWGFFHHFLTAAAHDARKRRADKGQFVELSGYLWGFKKNLIDKIPYESAEDSVVPLIIYNKGYKVAYVPESRVYTKGPSGVDDWVQQKSRTIKAHEKLSTYQKDTKLMKTMKNEIFEGTIFALGYKIKSLKEMIWLVELFPLRLYIWNKSKSMPAYKDGWAAVKSTKVNANGNESGS
jgi:cellulose synthase/poly-beta-1,6-N-acetylglucosamine synthase-like glycosyltransferase